MHWAYIAGFLDGEGSIYVRRSKGKINGFIGIVFCQSGPSGLAVLTEMKEFFEGEGFRMDKLSHKGVQKKSSFKSNLEIYQLHTVNRESVKGILQKCLPYLRVKKNLAEDAVRYLIMFPSLSGYAAITRDTDDWKAARGSDHYGAVLNEQQVKDIKGLLKFGKLGHKQIGRHYGVSRVTIGNISRGISWKHVTL